MNPAFLLAHFDRISGAPDAVPHLRSFLLDLAVRGKLLPQDSAHEPAHELLKRIQAEKAKLVRDGEIAKAKPLPPIRPDEPPFSAPQGWVWARLGEIARRIHYGYTASANPSLRGVRLLRITDIQDNAVDWTTVPGVEISDGEVEHYALERGDILIARTGGTIGKTFLVDDLPVTAVFASYLIRVQGATALYDRYLKLFMESPVYWKQLEEGARGAGQPNVNGKTLAQMIVPVPSAAEQRRIVAKVDELMALCDRLEQSSRDQEMQRERVASSALHHLRNGASGDSLTGRSRFYIDHLDDFTAMSSQLPDLRRTILSLAVRGRLVPQNLGEERASELVKRIQAEKTKLTEAGSLKKDKKTWEGLPKSPPFEIPPNWTWTRLQDVFEISRGGSPRPAGDPRYFGGPIPWITVREITKDLGKYLTDTEGGLTEEGADRSRFINPGDLLLTNSGATLGVPKISKIRACMNDGVAVLRQFHSVPLNDFAYIYLHSQTDAFRLVNQGMGQPNLNTPIIAGWFFPLPPLEEQQRIVKKVEELMDLCDQMEISLLDTQQQKRILLESVLHHALVTAEQTAKIANSA